MSKSNSLSVLALFCASLGILLCPSVSYALSSPSLWSASSLEEASFQSELHEIESFFEDENTEEITASTSSREARAWKKIERRFHRQFKRFSKRLNHALEKYSPVELAEILKTSDIRSGNLVKNAISSHPSLNTIYDENGNVSPKALSEILHNATSDEYSKILWKELETEVRSYGSASAYLKAQRSFLKPFRSVNGCLWKEGAVRTLSAPLNAVAYVNAGATVLVGLTIVLPIEIRRKERGKAPYSWISQAVLFPFGLVAKVFTYEKLAFRGDYPEYDCAFQGGSAFESDIKPQT
jgi:hypothetical protein